MRKPGVNPEPVDGMFDRYVGDGHVSADDPTRYSIEVWQRYASPVWMDINPSDTLQGESAREHEDERHICPLQLQVIERGIELWTNPGDTVASPFAGIGSEGYVAVRAGRKFFGTELKKSYYEQGCRNLVSAENLAKQGRLFHAE
jgi:DNA modification methylase